MHASKAQGSTQFELMRLLLRAGTGATVDQLADNLTITKSAVRQHLMGLERDQLVSKGVTRPSGGRPEQLYILTDAGKEIFPRQYSWFSELLLSFLAKGMGEKELEKTLSEMGTSIGASVMAEAKAEESLKERADRMIEVMQEKGYDAQLESTTENLDILASNCVFHAVALKEPSICKFDIALVEAGTGARVEHLACMAKGEAKCRFRLHS